MNAVKAKFNKVITLVEQGENGNGSLYIGNIKAAGDGATLKKYNINSIVGLCPDEPKAIEDHETVSAHYYYPILDHTKQEINFDIFKRLALVVRSDIENGYNVLVHCHAGRSRSATFVLFYQMTLEKYKNVPLKTLLFNLHEIHPLTAPNTGFVRQLAQWEKNHRSQSLQTLENKIDYSDYNSNNNHFNPITSQVENLESIENLYPIRHEHMKDFREFMPSYMQDGRDPAYIAADEQEDWIQRHGDKVQISKEGSHGSHAMKYTTAREDALRKIKQMETVDPMQYADRQLMRDTRDLSGKEGIPSINFPSGVTKKYDHNGTIYDDHDPRESDYYDRKIGYYKYAGNQ